MQFCENMHGEISQVLYLLTDFTTRRLIYIFIACLFCSYYTSVHLGNTSWLKIDPCHLLHERPLKKEIFQGYISIKLMLVYNFLAAETTLPVNKPGAMSIFKSGECKKDVTSLRNRMSSATEIFKSHLNRNSKPVLKCWLKNSSSVRYNVALCANS